MIVAVGVSVGVRVNVGVLVANRFATAGIWLRNASNKTTKATQPSTITPSPTAIRRPVFLRTGTEFPGMSGARLPGW